VRTYELAFVFYSDPQRAIFFERKTSLWRWCCQQVQLLTPFPMRPQAIRLLAQSVPLKKRPQKFAYVLFFLIRSSPNKNRLLSKKERSRRELSMSNNYLQPGIAQSYEQLPKQLKSLLGYPFVLQELGIAANNSAHLLDYGCGTGEFAHILCEQFAHLTITAVDESAEMINIAQDRHAHPRITYQVIEENSLHFLPDYSVDAAMALFVLINVSSQQHLLHLLREVSRVLKPSAPFVVLDAHPDSLGKRFLDYQGGEPGKRYQPGESYPVQFFPSNTPMLQVDNYYWPKEMYLSLLSTVGFSQIQITEPTLQDLREEELTTLAPRSGSLQTFTEWKTPPYLILRAVKL
jgi:ubiquinone/menaquinone biosynthesis C-methylase UbiE